MNGGSNAVFFFGVAVIMSGWAIYYGRRLRKALRDKYVLAARCDQYAAALNEARAALQTYVTAGRSPSRTSDRQVFGATHAASAAEIDPERSASE